MSIYIEYLSRLSRLFSNLRLRAEKRNKHARVLAARQSPKFEKNGENFVDLVNKKSYDLSCAFAIFPVSSNILTSPMESWSNVLVEN